MKTKPFLMIIFLAMAFLNNMHLRAQINKGVMRAIITSTFLNKNVYKTKAPLIVRKVYYNGRPSTDLRDFTILPNPIQHPVGVTGSPIPTVTKTVTTNINSVPISGAPTNSSQTITTTIPSTNTVTINTGSSPNPPVGFVGTTTLSTSTTYSVPAQLSSKNFIRYTVVNEDNDYKYIRILPGCNFTGGASPADTLIEYGAAGSDDPSDYIFQVTKKNLTFNNHYLANSAIIGKATSLPIKFRKEYWDNKNIVLQGSLNIGYTFGWKHKLGNNPYHSTYMNVILWGIGVSQQKYFRIAGKYSGSNKDSLSSKTDEFAFTYLTSGIAFEWDKFNIGIFFGKDKMFGRLKDWVYQDKWWWGFGIGYELFK